MRIAILVLALAAVAPGCIGMKKYTALEGQLDSVRTEMSGRLDARAAEIQTVEEALAAERAEGEALRVKIADLEERNALLIKDKSKLGASVKEMADALRELEARKTASDARIAEYQRLANRLRGLIDAGRLQVKIVDGRMVVGLASDILFDSGVAQLSEGGRASLVEIGGILGEIPDRAFQVEGHTDNVPINNRTFKSNWDLGAARAVNVVLALNEGGVPLARLSAASYAEHHPVLPNDTPEGRAANRRIEIVVVPDLSLLPGSQELQDLADAE